MEQNIFKRKINYYLGNKEDTMVSIFVADINYYKLLQLIQNIPFLQKEKTFDIIRLKKCGTNQKEVLPDLSSVLNHYAITSQNFSVLEYKFEEENIAIKEFFSSQLITLTDAYDVYVKWQERSELAIYLSEFLADGRAAKTIDLDFSRIINYMLSLELSPMEQQNLFKNIYECFSFSHVEDIPCDTINVINIAAFYNLFNLNTSNRHLQKIYEIGKNNFNAINFNFLKKRKNENNNSKLITVSSTIEEEMLKSTSALGNIAAFYQDYRELKNDNYFKCTILNSDGELYCYHGMIDYIRLYQWMNEINKKYYVTHQKRFDTIAWDCYKKVPILDNYLDPIIAKKQFYKIVNIDLSQGKVDIRNGIASNIYIEWQEIPKICIMIDQFLEDFIKKPEIDFSKFIYAINKMNITNVEKQQIINDLFSLFNFTLSEIIPSTIIDKIKTAESFKSLDLKQAKSRLDEAIIFGTNNNQSFSLLDKNSIKLIRTLSNKLE